MLFSVRSCGHVSLALSALPGEVIFETYIIEIQNQTGYSVIRNGRDGDVMKEVATPGVLTCDEHQTFWVDWTGGHVRLGQGANVGSKELIGWHDDSPHDVLSVSVRSNQDTASWFVLREEVKCFKAMVTSI